MRIGIFHGYELGGSGSNEYTRYLSRALARLGHEVHVFCREPAPERVAHVARALAPDGRELFRRDAEGACTVHQLPHARVRPVFLTDKQRDGNVKALQDLTDAELDEYHAVTVAGLRAALARQPLDVLHCNHLVHQPLAAAETGVPFVVYPHGSAIEYTVRKDPRLRERARRALQAAAGVVSGNREVLDRILALYPDDRAALEAKSVLVGVGVDTSLFRPVARERRRDAVGELRGPFAGKPPRLGEELRRRLDGGDVDAVTAYRAAYDHAEPDEDLAEKCARIPWETGPVLLFVGALTAGKGLQSLIAALPLVPGAHLAVVGSGAYRETLEALVHALATANRPLFDALAARGFDLDRSDLTGPWPDVEGVWHPDPGLAGRVHFFGRLDHDRLRHVFPCADLAVFPSVVPEAYPLVLMESLSNGVLPLVSDFSGFRDGLDGLEPLLGKKLVDRLRLPVEPEGRVAGIAGRIRALLGETGRSAELRALAVAHFDWSRKAQEMADAYESLVARSRKA